MQPSEACMSRCFVAACSFIYLFQSSQIMINALLTSALFFRTTRHPTSVQEAELYLGEMLCTAAEAVTVKLVRCVEDS